MDTNEGRYKLSLPGIFNAVVIPTSEFFFIRGSILFIPYRFHPLEKIGKRPSEKKARPKGKKRAFSLTSGLKMLRELIGSFWIRKLYLNVDTEDFSLNARLIPVFSALNTENIRLQANFEGQASLVMDLRTRLGALIWAFVKIKYKSMLNQ